MKKIFFALLISVLLFNCKAAAQTSTSKQNIKVIINLNEITDDKVHVTLVPPKITTTTIDFCLPKIVPGTYSIDNYGNYIDSLKAFDKKGNKLTITKKDENTWSIQNANNLTKITYWVNDTFDTEKGTGFGSGDIFSPTGSNIESNKNILINTHCFVGYFKEFMSTPYEVQVNHPEILWGATSMLDLDKSTKKDLFVTSKYAELVENPIMYSRPDYTSFTINGMEIKLCVYSPTGKFTAQSITPGMKTMMTAQNNFLGNFDTTKKYTILLYLSDQETNDAKGFGALEHPTATTVVFPEAMPKDELIKQMKDVVSHEFFHIVTPLTIHSNEIQYFDFNAPKMSQHLWMYEGVTEYFANLFQINQGLITENEFYNRLANKIEQAKTHNDTMPFTTMSANVLESPYKEEYLNVYEKGTLINMCIDIIIREKSNGKKGILDLMQKLSKEYGPNKPFDDDKLFEKITQLTYPEVGEFLKTHVAGTTPIPYEKYFEKMGIQEGLEKKAAPIFIKNETPYINVIQETNEIIVVPEIELNPFFTNLGLKGKDIILEINDVNYDLENIYQLLDDSANWHEDDAIKIKIKREEKIETIKGKVKLPYEDAKTYKVTDNSKEMLRNAWLKK